MITSLRERCVTEALSLIAENGIERLSLRDVARRLSVSHQAPYKHYSSREHLLAVACGRAYADLGRALLAREKQSDPALDLGEIGKAYLRFASQNPILYRLLFAVDRRELEQFPDANAHVEVALEELREAIRRMTGVADGEFVESCAHFAWATVHGLASLHVHRASDEALVGEDSLGFICAAIRARAQEFEPTPY